MPHDDLSVDTVGHAATGALVNTSHTSHHNDPSPQLISELQGLVEKQSLPDAPPEAFHELLSESLARVLQEPNLHWWCHANLRPISIELLHIFSLDENDCLQQFKDIMENVLAVCLDCTESYQQDRRVYLSRLLKQHDEDVVTVFFYSLLDWDYARLEKRMQALLDAPPTAETLKMKKIGICEILIDPSLLLLPKYSERISAPLTKLLHQMLTVKKMKILSVLPGLWLLMLHQDPVIQTWAAHTSNLAAAQDSLVPERWTGWEQFPAIWRMALDMANGFQISSDKTSMPLTSDPVRIWRAIRTMLSTMGRNVIRLALKSDLDTWKSIHLLLLKLIRDPGTQSAIFVEACRITFYLLGNLKQEFWMVDGRPVQNLGEAMEILHSVFQHRGTQDYILALATKDRINKDVPSAQALSRAYAEYTTWISHFINSLSSAFELSKVLASTASSLLGIVGKRIASRITSSEAVQAMDQDPKNIYLEYDLEILNIVFQLFAEKPSDSLLAAVAGILSEHWSWLTPICMLGPGILRLESDPIQRVYGLAIRASASSRKIAFALQERETEIMWRNYTIGIETAKAEVVGTLETANPLIWLQLAQTTTTITKSEIRDQLSSEKQEQLMEWQICMVEQLSKLALLPKLETKSHFSQGALHVCSSFNDDLDVVFRASSILLQGFAEQGETWLKRLTDDESRRFLVKLLRLWCSPDPETRTQALFIVRSAWHEVTRSSCLRLAFQTGGEKIIEELDSILADFRNRGSPGGATPPVLFELLLDSVTTLFLNNPIDGEGGLYLQIFLDLTSSQDVARHLSLIKKLWNSIWLSVKAAFVAGRTTWADRQDRGETIRTMKIVTNVGLLVIGKIRYFERLLEFEKQDLDTDVQDQDITDGYDEPRSSTKKETMPLDAMKDALPRIADWTYAQDTTLCTSAIELVCAVLNLLADHDNVISDYVNTYLSAIAEGNPKVKSLLTMDQREVLWIALSRHVAYKGASSASPPSPKEYTVQEKKSLPSQPAPIEISDDDFSDLENVDLTDMDFDDNVEENLAKETSANRPAAASSTTAGSDFFYRLTPTNNPFQSKLNFAATGPNGGIPAGGSTSRRLPASLSRFNINISSKSPSKPVVKTPPVKKGSKLSQMRADHRRERSNIVEATKEARQTSRQQPSVRAIPPKSAPSLVPESESESESESDADDHDNGFGSLVDAEEKWINRNKAQEPRKTKLLELTEVMNPAKIVDPIAARRQKAIDDAQRHNRLTPSLAALHAQILKWDVSAPGDRPPGAEEYSTIPSSFESVNEYIKAFEPLLVLECWQQLMGAREEVNQSSDSVFASCVNRVSIDNFQDIHMKIPLDKASSIMVEDVVVISDPSIKDVFTAVGNAIRAKPFFAKVQSITRAKGVCGVVFRTYLKIEESSPLMFIRPQTTWSVLKMINLTTTHREYAALTAMRYYELCDDILNPPNTAPRKPSLENVQNVMDVYKVNTPQAQAIVAAVEKPKGFSLIQGPPGTGKTKTILGLVGALLADGSQQRSAPIVQSSRASDRPLQTGTVSRILVCAPSNAAIDEIVKRLMGGIRNTLGEMFTPKVVRVGTLETVNAEVKDVALDTLIAKELESTSSSKEEFQSAAQSMASMREKMRQLQQDLEKARLELVQAKDQNDPMSIANAQSKVKAINKSKWQLGQELDTARSSHAEASQKKDQARKNARNKILGEADVICSTLSASGHDLLTTSTFTFETVIIDEAAQSVEISSLIPLKYGCKRCILVGDPNQLPPTVISQLAAKYAYNQSLFVRIQSLSPTSVHLLSIQYRMHPDISAFPSREFYKTLLKDGPDMANKTRAEWHRNPITSPYRFFDVHEGREQIGLSHSQHNPVEAEAAAALLEGLCNSNPSLNFFRRVGVISPYKQQVRTLREYFQRTFDKEILEAVDFNTVDGFQGQEKDIIIFSCVRASTRGSVGFLADIRRMNVALTRARQSLFILGHAETLRREEIWGDLVKDAESRGLFTKVTPGIFGRRGTTAPKNILQSNSAVDRRNELYRRVADNRTATTIIDRPMATMEDIIDVAFYPTLPTTTDGVDPRNPSSARNVPPNNRGRENGSRSLRDEDRKDRNLKPVGQDGSSSARSSYNQHHPHDPRAASDPNDRSPAGSRKRRQDEWSDSGPGQRQPTDRISNRTDEPGPSALPHSTSTGGAIPPPPSSFSHDESRTSDLTRPPSPKRIKKPATSLFLKSKPMSMKKSAESSKQYDIPTRERLAAGVIPIRKSYPSGPSRPPRPPPPAKRQSEPSLDDILNLMNKRPHNN